MPSYEKHGMWRAPEYTSWAGMIARCTYKGNPRYSRYGGRNIKVCERWRYSFLNFYADMGNKPTHQHSLDRIDNDGDYTPENCRWANVSVQALNKKRPSTNTSGYKGVSWYKTRDKWIAYININKKSIKLGYFKKKSDAIKARQEAEILYHQPLLTRA